MKLTFTYDAKYHLPKMGKLESILEFKECTKPMLIQVKNT
jgi:hypothetical protein